MESTGVARWPGSAANTVVEVALNQARIDANRGWILIAEWREGCCNAVRFLAGRVGDEPIELAALGAENEIRFLEGYQRRHFQGGALTW